MLVLTRGPDQSIIIAGEIIVTILEVRGDRVKLGIKAPPNVVVNRWEIEEAILRGDPPPRPPADDAPGRGQGR